MAMKRDERSGSLDFSNGHDAGRALMAAWSLVENNGSRE